MWKDFLTPNFIKTLLIIAVVVFAMFWITGLVEIFHKSGQLPGGYIVKDTANERILQQALEDRGYWKGQADAYQKQIEENKILENNLIVKGKKEIQNYQSGTINQKVDLFNNKLTEFLKPKI